jgi:hypothetical protein
VWDAKRKNRVECWLQILTHNHHHHIHCCYCTFVNSNHTITNSYNDHIFIFQTTRWLFLFTLSFPNNNNIKQQQQQQPQPSSKWGMKWCDEMCIKGKKEINYLCCVFRDNIKWLLFCILLKFIGSWFILQCFLQEWKWIHFPGYRVKWSGKSSKKLFSISFIEINSMLDNSYSNTNSMWLFSSSFSLFPHRIGITFRFHVVKELLYMWIM